MRNADDRGYVRFRPTQLLSNDLGCPEVRAVKTVRYSMGLGRHVAMMPPSAWAQLFAWSG